MTEDNSVCKHIILHCIMIVQPMVIISSPNSITHAMCPYFCHSIFLFIEFTSWFLIHRVPNILFSQHYRIFSVVLLLLFIDIVIVIIIIIRSSILLFSWHFKNTCAPLICLFRRRRPSSSPSFSLLFCSFARSFCIHIQFVQINEDYIGKFDKNNALTGPSVVVDIVAVLIVCVCEWCVLWRQLSKTHHICINAIYNSIWSSAHPTRGVLMNRSGRNKIEINQ